MTDDEHDRLEVSDQPPSKEKSQNPSISPVKRRQGKFGEYSTIAVGVIVILIFILLLPIFIGSQTLLSFHKSVPHEERYYYINELLKEIKYEEVGGVIEERWDDNPPHPLNPVSLHIEFEGREAFEILAPRIIEAVDVECRSSETRLRCPPGRPEVTLTLQDNDHTSLIIKDVGVGR